MKLTIRRKMILFIGVPTTAIILGTMVWVLGFAERQARRAHEAEMAETASMAAARFNDYLGNAARLADTTARFIRHIPDLTDDQIFAFLTGNVRIDRRVYGAAMAFEPGTYKAQGVLFSPYVYRGAGDGDLVEMDITEDVYDWYRDTKWQWWHLPKNSGKGEWIEPYFDEGAGNILMTTYSAPFERSGAFGGITTVDIDLQTVHSDISSTLPPGSKFSVLGPAGQIIFSPVTSEIMGDSVFDLLASSGRAGLQDVVRNMISGGSGEVAADNLFEPGRSTYAFAPIPSPGWTFVTYMPEDLGLANFYSRRRYVFSAFLAAAALVLAVTLFASGKLANPISLLRERVLRIADGEPGITVADVRTGDEIEELAGAFGTMQLKVADRETKLESARETTLCELLESAPDAMIIADSEGRIVRFNDQMTRIFGYDRGELDGMPVESLMPDRFRAGHGGHLRGYFKNPKVRQMGRALELLGQRKNGSEFPIEIGLSPFHEPGGLMVVSSIRDITERRKAEDELRKLNQAVEQGSAIVFITDADGTIEYVNPRFTEVTGYTAEEAIGQSPRILKSGFQDPGIYKDLWDTLKNGEEWHGEFHNRRKDGSFFWASAALSPIRDHDGNVSHFVGIEDDITGQREIAEAIKEKEERFRTLVDNIPGTVYRRVYGSAPHMQFISDDVKSLTGYPAENLIGNNVLSFDSLIHPDDRAAVAEKIARAISAKREWGIEYRIQHRDGSTRWVGETGRAIFHSGGKVDFLDGVIFDITKRKEMEAQLRFAREQAESANRAKSDFLSHMSHELRTPLNGVLGYAQILHRSPDLTEKQKRSIDAIISCGDHLLSLINDVLDLSKIEAGHIEIDVAPCDLHRLIDGVTNILSPKAVEKGLKFTVDISPEVPVGIRTDAAKLRQILVNLLGNAVKFTAQGKVTLTVGEVPGEKLRFAISDSGVGIAPQELEEIFDPFKQVEAGKAAGGTGLGLAITKRLAEMLHGSLNVKSTVGKGSTFALTIPLDEVLPDDLKLPGDDGSDLANVTLAPGQNFSVLVADDREPNRDILNQLLTEMGFSVELAQDGQEALEILRSGKKVDLALMDVRMPNMNGIDATRQIRADEGTKNLKVIAVTASVFPEFKEKAAESGFDDFIAKPFRTSDLVAKIKSHIGAVFVPIAPHPQSAPAPAAPPVTNLPPDIPPEFRRELAVALKIRNLTAINALAKKLGDNPDTSAAAERIEKLARAFDFKGLSRLVEDDQIPDPPANG